VELEALKQQEEKMRLKIVQIKETTDRYKKELTVAMERESSLEQSRAQLEVDWQRRCEDTEILRGVRQAGATDYRPYEAKR